MKTFFKSLIFALSGYMMVSCNTGSDILPEEVFVKYYGTQTQQVAYDLTQNANGEFIIFGTRRTGNETANDFYILKVDAQGNLIDDRSWGLDNADDIASRVKVIGNGYLVVGSTAQLDAALVPREQSLYWAHLSENFEIIFSDTLSSTGTKNLAGADILMTMDDSVLVTGYSETLESNQSGQPMGDGERRIFVSKLAFNGSVGWRKTYGFAGSRDQGKAIFEKNNGDLVVFGVTDQIGSNGERGQNVVIFQLNPRGTSPVGQVPKYGTTMGAGDANDVVSDVIRIPGGYAMTGTSTLGTASFPFLMVVDDNAQLIAADTLTNPFGSNARGLGVTRGLNQDYIVVGQLLNLVEPASGVSKNHEMMFLRTSQVGVAQPGYANHFGLVAGNDEAVGAITLENGSIAMAGTSDFGSGVSMITLIKMNDKGLIKHR